MVQYDWLRAFFQYLENQNFHEKRKMFPSLPSNFAQKKLRKHFPAIKVLFWPNLHYSKFWVKPPEFFSKTGLSLRWCQRFLNLFIQIEFYKSIVSSPCLHPLLLNPKPTRRRIPPLLKFSYIFNTF